MNLTFFGGLNTVGGNRILLEDSGTRLLLDFGMNFAEHGKYFEEYLAPRVGNGFGDLLELGLIPYPRKLPGFYRDDLLSISGFPENKEILIDGILLSHVHYDHSGDISLAHERVPVYASEITKLMAKALVECGQRGLEAEVYNYRRRPLERGSEPVERDWRVVQSGKKFKIGGLEVVPYAVDHSVAGAMSYLIHTSEGSVFYTGDLRLHGTYGELTRRMLEEVSREKVDLMLCEGTRVNEVESQSEQSVRERSDSVVSKCKQLVIADYAFKDLTRFETFYNIAKDNKRKMAVGLKDAYIIRELGKQLKLPKINDENIQIYLDRRGSCTWCESDYRDKWMKDLYSLDNTITAEEMRKNEGKYIVRLSFYDFNDLIDFKPSAGSQYIHSMCEAFNEEMAISEERMKNWLGHFGLPLSQIHCSGHANALDLKEIINKIRPKMLTPIHTEHAEKFRNLVVAETKVVFGEVVR